MKQKTIITTFILILSIGLLDSCKKENHPSSPDSPESTYQIPPIDEYMPERLLHLFDSLNVLHRGDEPPIINGNFMAESMYLCIVDKVPESSYMMLPGPMNSNHYYEFKEQKDGLLGVAFKCPIGIPGENGFLEQFDTDSSYFIIKDSLTLFTNDPIAPAYFKSNKFIPEDLSHAYIIGNGRYFTLYFYEIHDTSQSLPLNAVVISGKTSTNEEGKTIIEDFWWGIETMKYYNEGIVTNMLIQYGNIPTPGDIIIRQSPDALVEGCYGK